MSTLAPPPRAAPSDRPVRGSSQRLRPPAGSYLFPSSGRSRRAHGGRPRESPRNRPLGPARCGRRLLVPRSGIGDSTPGWTPPRKSFHEQAGASPGGVGETHGGPRQADPLPALNPRRRTGRRAMATQQARPQQDGPSVQDHAERLGDPRHGGHHRSSAPQRGHLLVSRARGHRAHGGHRPPSPSMTWQAPLRPNGREDCHQGVEIGGTAPRLLGAITANLIGCCP